MASLVKRTKRSFKRVTLGWRDAVMARTPAWAKRAFGPTFVYLDSMLVDHGFVRLIYLNKHRIGDRAWRAAQPTPHQFRGFAAAGIKTIVNLRGPRVCGSYWLEQDACRKLGLTMVDCQMRSRAAPTRDELRRAREMFERVEFPILMHCKSGADRAGLMSALYLHTKLGEPIDTAKNALALRYGHIRHADTGILDHFFDEYLAYAAKQPIAFWDWVETVYDQEAVTRSFKADGFVTRLVSGILRRE